MKLRRNTPQGKEKGFTAFLEIYDRKEMICKVKADFDGDINEVTEEDREQIRELLILISGLDESEIDCTVMEFLDDED